MKPFALLLATAFLLTACQSLPTYQGGQFPAKASQLTHWLIKGKIGYHNENDGGSAHLTWRQNAPGTGKLTLSGPLHFGHAVIHYNKQGATLDTGKKHYTAPSPTRLAWKVTGMYLPVPALSWWVKGLAWPQTGSSHRQTNRHGQLTHFRQAGWQLDFDRFKKFHGLVLPSRIKGHRGNARFTLLITRWAALPDINKTAEKQTNPDSEVP